MYRQITLTLMILLLIISCGTKKSMIKSISENNIETEINSILNTTTEIDDSIGITINEQIEETTTDTSKHQTTRRIINRRTDITKAGNTTTKQTEETHTQIQEENKEDNQTKTIKESPFKLTYDYIIIICFLILFLIYLYKLKKKDV